MAKGRIHTGYCPLPLSYSAYAISRVLYLAEARPLSFIYDDNHLPPPATYPPTSNEQPLIVGVHGLATHETYCRGVLLPSRWALTPPSHPYPCGRSFSSTLLYPHGYQAVNLRGALRCSDFPPPPCGGSDRARMLLQRYKKEMSLHHLRGYNLHSTPVEDVSNDTKGTKKY